MLCRLYFWSHPPMMLLYLRVQFIPDEIVDAFYWPLLFVMDHCPIWDAQCTEIKYVGPAVDLVGPWCRGDSGGLQCRGLE